MKNNLPNNNLEQLNKLSELIRERVGIVVDPNLSSLRIVFKEICDSFNYSSYDACLKALEKSNEMTPEFEHLVNALTVGESYFFRDQAQTGFLKDFFLPEIIEKKRKDQQKILRIWSAGCASGQEIYTIAILLNELLSDKYAWDVHLLGTDINPKMLANAIRGTYNQWSLHATKKSIIDRYFIKQNDHYLLLPVVKNMVKFFYHNLTQNNYPSILTQITNLDLIICRNVFIYFDKTLVNDVLGHFEKCLVPNGGLLLGSAEYIATLENNFVAEQVNSVTCYRRREITVNKETKEQKKRVSSAFSTLKSDQTIIKEVAALLTQKEWQATLDYLKEFGSQLSNKSLLLQFQAMALANLGKAAEAIEFCQRSIELSQLDPHAYLLKALILFDLNNDSEAEKALRQALFLDAQFVEAQYRLGLLLIRQGKIEKGLNNLRIALRNAEKRDANQRIHYMSKLTFSQFVNILHHEILIYEQLS
ncbi:MAG: CheR family methyltransferase [Pseudomonadota bacterium]|nr:hypothetical protein [Gammaproteobacteria bacterium]MBU1629110.1 hypothetical protein [Gammaproteobacteria bacterium]MBU1926667.1 hypothetical protein [Gammaproteobacteria bacterium]MBU2545757.1 hypothetical protein [Gammaproteobacteria bacterium]